MLDEPVDINNKAALALRIIKTNITDNGEKNNISFQKSMRIIDSSNFEAEAYIKAVTQFEDTFI